MSVNPEKIVCAFYEQLLVSVGDVFKTTGRRAIYWTKVQDQPALFVRHISDDDVWSGDGLQSLTIGLEIWIYARTPIDGTPDKTLSELVDLVRSTLRSGMLETNATLNDLVEHVRIEGRSEYDPGDLDQQGKAVIPVKILTIPGPEEF